MLKADDTVQENTININEEITEEQLKSYSSLPKYYTPQPVQNNTNTQQQIENPTPTVTQKFQEKKKNQFQMHSKLNIIPNSKKEDLNTQYLATLPGVLKLIQVLLGSAAFVLAICSDRRSTTSAWTEHITFETTLVVSAFIIGYVIFPHLTIIDEKTRKGLVVLELLFYGSNTMCYFISIWLMIHLSASWIVEGRGAAIMTAILCVALCILYAFETLTKFKAWRGVEDYQKHNFHDQHQPIHHLASPPTSYPAGFYNSPLQHNDTSTNTNVESNREHSDV